MLVGELRDMSYYYGCQLSGHATLGIAEKIFELLSHLTTKKGGTLRLYKRNLHAVPNSCGKTRQQTIIYRWQFLAIKSSVDLMKHLQEDYSTLFNFM